MTYRPGEDSYFLKEYLESLDLERKKVLDMGTGSGIFSVTAAEKGAEVVAADIDPEALEDVKEKVRDHGFAEEIDFIESDLFEKVSREFDLIVFNPPYLPGEKHEDLQGGKSGVELTERFLEDVDGYLKDDGYAVFIASDRSDINRLEKRFELERLEEKKLWFETLYLFRSD